ncbi:MAG: ankyrin repeat domain-containing protein [Spirochaetales bacterium]
MKWIIFCESDENNDVKKISQFFEKKKVACTTYQFNSLHNEEPSNENVSENLEKICEVLASATHCILTNINDIPLCGVFLYTLGVLSGGSRPVFITGTNPSFPDTAYRKFFPVCDNTKELLTQLENYFPTFYADEEKDKARRHLFNMGIPLTPDAFSHYISANNIEICDIFFAAGMDVDSCDSSGTPMLCIAARNGKLDMVEWLLEKHADIEVISQDRGYTPLMDAVWKNEYNVVEFLVNKGANLDVIGKDGQPILVLAAGIANVKVCRILAEHGGDINIKDKMGMSALEYATLFNNVPLINALKVIET